MKLAFSLFYLGFILNNSFGCSLNKNYKYGALSAPISTLMKELDVLEQVSFIGSFHPFKEKIKKIDGGIFLRLKNLNLDSKTVLFLDKSQNLKKELIDVKAKVEMINTYGLSSIDATEYLLTTLQRYLVNCSKRIKKLRSRIEKIQNKLKSAKFNKTYLFFLGELSKKKNPNLIIARDGIVLDLLKNQSFKTYPSNLAYVSWSAKIIKDLRHKFLVGIVDSKGRSFSKKTNERYNLSTAGALIPGYRQVLLLEYFLNEIERLNEKN